MESVRKRDSERERGKRQTARETETETHREMHRECKTKREMGRGRVQKKEILNEERGRAGERERE